MGYRIFLVMLLVSTFPSIRTVDDKVSFSGAGTSSDNGIEFNRVDDGNGENQTQAAPAPAETPEAKILTYLKALTDKIDRLETGFFKMEQILLKNREITCDSTKCEQKPSSPLSEIPKDDVPVRDCCAVQRAGTTENGNYTVYLHENNQTRAIEVYCDMKTKGGGWTVIQRREETPPESFNMHWDDYVRGFGDMETWTTFWQGLPDIAALTEDNEQAVRFDMTDWMGDSRYAEYDNFHVAGGTDLFRMTVSGYSGNAGDSFSENSGNAFSTPDQDNDLYYSNCAAKYKGGWWYRACHKANPNGLYLRNGGPGINGTGVTWTTFKGFNYSLKNIDMKLRNRRYANGCAPDS